MFKNRVFVTIVILFVCIVATLSLSYYTISQFTFSEDRVVYGKRQSSLAAEIRVELLKRNDIERVSIKAADDIVLAGFYVRRPEATANLVLCHGYKGSKEFMYGYIDMFPGYNILMFDFRAHGESSGAVISLGCHEYKDVVAAVRFMKERSLKNKNKSLPLIIIGISMGGASSLKAAEKEPELCDALVIDSTFAELKAMFSKGFSLKTGLPYYPFLPIVQTMFHYIADCDVNHMSTIESVKKINQPILFIHSCNDSFIRPENSLQLYTAALNKNTKLWIGPKCRHGWLHTYYADLYKSKVIKFLRDASIVHQ